MTPASEAAEEGESEAEADSELGEDAPVDISQKVNRNK